MDNLEISPSGVIWAEEKRVRYDSMAQGYLDALVPDCGNSIAKRLELLQSCIKPSICKYILYVELWCSCFIEHINWTGMLTLAVLNSF